MCRQFYRWARLRDPSFSPSAASNRGRAYSIFLWDFAINRARVTTCYPPSNADSGADSHGWCGTCYQDGGGGGGEMRPGQEGYCDVYHGGSERRTDKEMGRPTHDAKWGWGTRWNRVLLPY